MTRWYLSNCRTEFSFCDNLLTEPDPEVRGHWYTIGSAPAGECKRNSIFISESFPSFLFVYSKRKRREKETYARTHARTHARHVRTYARTHARKALYPSRTDSRDPLSDPPSRDDVM